jgi:tRNA (guanine-N7-)-methyltransferase
VILNPLSDFCIPMAGPLPPLADSPRPPTVEPASLDAARALERPPLDLARLFGNDRPAELEIGTGKGRFLTGAAAARPEVNFLGIERSRKFFKRTADAVASAGLTNVRLLCVEASAVVRNFLPDACLAAVHVYYPDPWPKRKHAGRRIFQPEFPAQVARVLVPGGRLYFQTDVRSYAVVVRELLAGQTALQVIEDAEIPCDRTDVDTAGTHWENKSRRLGLSAYRIVAARP